MPNVLRQAGQQSNGCAPSVVDNTNPSADDCLCRQSASIYAAASPDSNLFGSAARPVRSFDRSANPSTCRLHA